MSHRRRQFLRTLGTVGAAATVAGCVADGGSSDGTEPATEPATTTGTATAVSAQSKFPDYNWGKLEGVDPTVATTITMSGFQFHPLVATMPPGTEVTVTNEDSADHTITIPALDIKKTLSGGGSTSFTVERTGTFDYVCEFHAPDMLGRLVVEEGVGTPMDTPTDTPSGGDTPTATEDDGGYY